MESLRQDISRLPAGRLFTYEDIDVEPDKASTLIKALSKLYRTGLLSRLSKGYYYKPITTRFGSFPPDIRSVVNQMLERQKDKISYLTGVQAFNSLGLTHQLSKDYTLATDKPRSPLRLGNAVIYFVLSRVSQSVGKLETLQIFDALSMFTSIPGADPIDVCKVIQGRLYQYTSNELDELVALAQSYPPSTQALVGLLLDDMDKMLWAKELQARLNPSTKYNPGVNLSLFTASLRWNIL